jgi:hypothetical protein
MNEHVLRANSTFVERYNLMYFAMLNVSPSIASGRRILQLHATLPPWRNHRCPSQATDVMFELERASHITSQRPCSNDASTFLIDGVNGSKRGAEGQNVDHGEFELDFFYKMLQLIVWSIFRNLKSFQHPP